MTTAASGSAEQAACCAMVYSKGLAFARPYACGRKAKFQRAGKWYCGMHDPVRVAEKSAERDSKRREQSKVEMDRWRMSTAAPDMLAALIAITDQLERIGDTRPHKDGQLIDDARSAIAKATGKDMP